MISHNIPLFKSIFIFSSTYQVYVVRGKRVEGYEFPMQTTTYFSLLKMTVGPHGWMTLDRSSEYRSRVCKIPEVFIFQLQITWIK